MSAHTTAELNVIADLLAVGDWLPDGDFELTIVSELLDAHHEIRVLKHRLAEQNNAITWDTTCLNCASLLDWNYEAYCQIERINEIDPEDYAKGSRDFGRGFALAMRLVKEAQQ